MAWLAFVIAFVAIGLGVALAAWGGSRRRTGAQPGRASRGATAIVAGLLIIAAGLVLPALMLVVNNDDQANATGGVSLSDAQQKGRVLFAQNCANCHTLRAANAVGTVGPNFDQLRPPAALVEDAVAKGRARGAGQMPAGLLSGQDLKDVAAFVAATAGR
ncbi:MAG TPA: c-type cytochrome [Solirubrobacteraceae bacterium]|nr:c-type cytochrome [Solirubrobacteraceae bacterium]